MWVINCREGGHKQQKYKSISNPKFLTDTKRYLDFCYVRIFHVIKYLIMGGFFINFYLLDYFKHSDLNKILTKMINRLL